MSPRRPATEWVRENGCPYTPNAGWDELRERVAARGIGERVRFLGPMSGAALDDLATQFAARVAKCGVPA